MANQTSEMEQAVLFRTLGRPDILGSCDRAGAAVAITTAGTSSGNREMHHQIGGVLRKLVAALVFLVACGAELPTVPCSPVPGAFNYIATLSSMSVEPGYTGTACSVQNTYTGQISFDESGSFVPSIPGVAKCSTDHDGCKLNIHCDSLVQSIPVVADFDGGVMSDGFAFKGVGVANGDYDHCSQLVFNISAIHE